MKTKFFVSCCQRVFLKFSLSDCATFTIFSNLKHYHYYYIIIGVTWRQYCLVFMVLMCKFCTLTTTKGPQTLHQCPFYFWFASLSFSCFVISALNPRQKFFIYSQFEQLQGSLFDIPLGCFFLYHRGGKLPGIYSCFFYLFYATK